MFRFRNPPAGYSFLHFQFITSLKSNLCKATTKQNMTTTSLSHAYITQLHFSSLYFNWNISVTDPKLLVF